MFAHELPQLRVFSDPPGPLPAPSALGTALSRPRTVVARGFVNVPADLPAHRRRTTPELPGDGTDAAPGMQEVRDRDPFRLGEKPSGDHDRPLMRDGSVLLYVSGLQNNRVAVPPASARTTADPHDPARFGIAHSLFHQLIIVSPRSVLWRGAPGLSWSFHLTQLQLLKAQVLQRRLDAKPSQWLTFRPSPTEQLLNAGTIFGYSIGYLVALVGIFVIYLPYLVLFVLLLIAAGFCSCCCCLSPSWYRSCGEPSRGQPRTAHGS